MGRMVLGSVCRLNSRVLNHSQIQSLYRHGNAYSKLSYKDV
jgi:hypothetical protein